MSEKKTIIKWIKLLTVTGGAQLLIQGISLLSGILIVRLLPSNEYAYYTLANTMLGTMTVLSDGGISSGVMVQGGKVWHDKKALGSVLNTGLKLRKRFAVFSLIVSLPVLAYLLHSHNASLLTIFLVCLSLIPTFLAALSDSILEVALKLHQDIYVLQKNQLFVAIMRFLLNVLTIFIFPFSYLVIITTGIPRLLGNFKLKTFTLKFTDKDAPIDDTVKSDILKLVKRMLPEIIYYCISGQVSIWLISLFGSTKSLAGLGALGRFAALNAVLAAVFSTLIVPRISKITNNHKLLIKYFLLSICAAVSISILIYFLGYILSSQLLWILGSQYANLNNELRLSFLSSGISFTLGIIFAVNISRGWVIPPYLYIILSLSYNVLAIKIVDLGSISGVVIFNCIISFLQLLTLFLYAIYRLKEEKKMILSEFRLYICNNWINKVPSHRIRLFFYKYLMKFDIANNVSILLNCTFDACDNLKIGENSVINANSRLDNRGGLVIGANVSISECCIILTADHEPQSEEFVGRSARVNIQDYCWLGTRCMILPGISLGKGCIVAAGSVVTKDVLSYDIVGGVPAKTIGKRNNQLKYNLSYKRKFH